MSLHPLPAALLALLSATAPATADWPAWRGPRGDGTSTEPDVPVEWSATRNVAWKTPLPGRGHASPIVSGDRVFVATAIEESQARCLVALDRPTGRILWQRTVATAPLEPMHGLNSPASSTPATDGRLVYVTFLDRQRMLVAAYDFDGNRKWLVHPGPFASVHGFCSSPVLFDDMLIVNGDHDGDAYIVALDRATGRTRWKTRRENRLRSYCAPTLVEAAGRMQLVLSGSNCIASYDPATGTRHWVLPGHPTEQTVASVVWNHAARLLFITGGYPRRHILTLRPDGHGVLTDSDIVWRSTKGVSYVPSPISAGDSFIVVDDNGALTCFRATDGAVLWHERLRQSHHASLVSADGHVYCLSDAGVTTVFKPGPAFEPLARNEIDEECFASPAISHRTIFLRSRHHLWAIARPK